MLIKCYECRNLVRSSSILNMFLNLLEDLRSLTVMRHEKIEADVNLCMTMSTEISERVIMFT